MSMNKHFVSDIDKKLHELHEEVKDHSKSVAKEVAKHQKIADKRDHADAVQDNVRVWQDF